MVKCGLIKAMSDNDFQPIYHGTRTSLPMNGGATTLLSSSCVYSFSIGSAISSQIKSLPLYARRFRRLSPLYSSTCRGDQSFTCITSSYR